MGALPGDLSYLLTIFFFFSSRRRHTRCLSDWSSDVCSSDLTANGEDHTNRGANETGSRPFACHICRIVVTPNQTVCYHRPFAPEASRLVLTSLRRSGRSIESPESCGYHWLLWGLLCDDVSFWRWRALSRCPLQRALCRRLPSWRPIRTGPNIICSPPPIG